MMKTIFASVAAFGLTFGSMASAQNRDFNDLGITVSAQTGVFTFEFEGTGNTGHTSIRGTAEVFNYNIGDVTSTVDVFGAYYRNYNGLNREDFGLGAAYTATYSVDDLRLYGSLEAEYMTRAQDWLVTPRLGVGYAFTPVVDGFAEVSHTWVGNRNWSRRGGMAEVGLNISLADNVTLTPSLRHNFNLNGTRGDTQAHVGLNFRF